MWLISPKLPCRVACSCCQTTGLHMYHDSFKLPALQCPSETPAYTFTTQTGSTLCVLQLQWCMAWSSAACLQVKDCKPQDTQSHAQCILCCLLWKVSSIVQAEVLRHTKRQALP